MRNYIISKFCGKRDEKIVLLRSAVFSDRLYETTCDMEMGRLEIGGRAGGTREEPPRR